MYRTVLSLLVGASLVAGCAVYPESTPVATPLRPALLPTWAVGDQIVTADRDGGQMQTWTVVATKGDRVSWESDQGESYTGFRNFVIPEIEWTSALWGSGSEEILKIDDDIFPLRVGKRMSIASQGSTSRSPEGWNAVRECRVVSQENITVTAGTFDTYKVVCTTDILRLTWYYAPEVEAPMVFIREQKATPLEPWIRVTQTVRR